MWCLAVVHQGYYLVLPEIVVEGLPSLRGSSPVEHSVPLSAADVAEVVAAAYLALLLQLDDPVALALAAAEIQRYLSVSLPPVS